MACASSLPSQRPSPLPVPRRSTGWSRPVFAEHAELAAAEAAQLQAARARRRPSRPAELRSVDHFATGMEVLKDGTELHLASFCLADAELHLNGADDPAFAALKARYSEPERGTGQGSTRHAAEPRPSLKGRRRPDARGRRRPDATVPPDEAAVGRRTGRTTSAAHRPSRPWMDPAQNAESTAGHVAAVVFARKPDGS